MKLHSSRLFAIANMVEKYKHGEVIADIGTDHAYLPCYLVSQGIMKKAYACDVAKGPLQASQETIAQYNLDNDVIPLLGSGMNPIKDKNVDMVSICGMGGKLIIDLLDEYPHMLENHRFVLQANIGIDVLRQYLYERNMIILDEDIVKDAHHIYEIIVCEKGEPQSYTKEDLYFGPVLRKNKNALFITKWNRQKAVLQRILDSLDETHPKYKKVFKEVQMIEGELHAG